MKLFCGVLFVVIAILVIFIYNQILAIWITLTLLSIVLIRFYLKNIKREVETND